MNFDTLNSDITCNCTIDAIIDNNSNFALKMNKGMMRDNDFKTYWEKGRRPELMNCTQICSHKGQSLSIVNNSIDLEKIINVYKQLFPFSPSYRTHCAIITLKENSGMVKSTPIEINPFHYDFYKSDDFNIEKIEVHKIISLSDV
ncbi:hypothetical protein LNQ49_22985 [Flavobacterium sp. F-65]|uniref:Uncharacterized protein n=1 Tax=Flavobacterium pisciphilum TaxID=2893755 RepID=A0ABS8N0B8_9FLAO|nr:hypothetical protein [Flavobacterium sp. F-65]MCC9074459.1 hypothetical protein [Flavobacterium sp. F-65]